MKTKRITIKKQLQRRNNKEREFDICINMKTSNRKELWLKILVNLGYIYIGIDKQLVKKEQIKIALLFRSYKVYNTEKTKNRKLI